MFCYENGLVFLIFVSDQKFKNLIDLLLITDGDKSHYVYIKDPIVRVAYNVLIVKMW